MFGIFGRNIPTARSLLNPFNMAGFSMNPAVYNPYSYVPQIKPIAPVNPATVPQENTTYTDYKKFNFGNPTAGLKIPTGLNPGFAQVNKVTTPITSPKQNQYNWGYTAGPVLPISIPQLPPLFKTTK